MQRSAPYRPSLPRRPNATSAPGTPGRCPLLGTSADPGTSLSFASDANQCYSTKFPVPISTIHQENYCLSAQYETCPVYRQHNLEGNGEQLLPLTALATGMALSTPTWKEPEMMTAAGSGAMGTAAMASSTYTSTAPAPMFNWEEPAHPDFQADMDAAASRRQTRSVDLRPVLLGLLLLALIPLAWWIWTSIRPDPRATTENTGAVVTLPTLVATSGVTGDQGNAAGPVTEVLPLPSATVGSAVIVDATAIATAEPTSTDLENIAATATALFVGATAVTECAAPDWWVTYTVEEGDTIEALAALRGILPEELIVANCLAGPELTPGALLRLPPVGVIISIPGQPTATPVVAASATPTRGPVLPTRPPLIFPTPTFPVVIILPTAQPTAEQPTSEPPTRPPARPTSAPTTAVQPTVTPPNPFATATPPGNNATATPPLPATAAPTRTPPSSGGTVTPTATGTAGSATQTPPSP